MDAPNVLLVLVTLNCALHVPPTVVTASASNQLIGKIYVLVKENVAYTPTAYVIQ